MSSTKIQIFSSSDESTKEYIVLKAGFKGSIAAEAGYYHAPYTPLGLTLNPDGPPLTWRSLLEFLSNVLNAPSEGKTSRLTVDQVKTEMQMRFPGPYEIGEEYNPDTDVWSWKLIFKDKHEEIIWHLKNSA
jgi:hypothetical protein